MATTTAKKATKPAPKKEEPQTKTAPREEEPQTPKAPQKAGGIVVNGRLFLEALKIILPNADRGVNAKPGLAAVHFKKIGPKVLRLEATNSYVAGRLDIPIGEKVKVAGDVDATADSRELTEAAKVVADYARTLTLDQTLIEKHMRVSIKFAEKWNQLTCGLVDMQTPEDAPHNVNLLIANRGAYPEIDKLLPEYAKKLTGQNGVLLDANRLITAMTPLKQNDRQGVPVAIDLTGDKITPVKFSGPVNIGSEIPAQWTGYVMPLKP